MDATMRARSLAACLRFAALLFGLPGLCAGSPAQDAPVTVFTARTILTMERANPEAQAVAVTGDRILYAGSRAEVERFLDGRAFDLDTRFADKVLLPGFMEQHIHPLLVALTLTTEVIAPEDWVLPGRRWPAASDPKAYRERLRAAAYRGDEAGEWLFSWGYHALWHGPLTRRDLDAISTTRPIVVWQRSCHEFVLNSAAIAALGLQEVAMQGRGIASTQYDWDEGHWWENGASELLLPALMQRMATPERLRAGLGLFVDYLAMRGVTAFNEPGALLVPGAWELYTQVLGAPKVPFSSSFIVDARSQYNAGLGPAEALAATQALVARAPAGKVSFLPKQVKLLADGAIVSLLMQLQGGYPDGHEGEWLMTPQALEERGKLYWDAGYQLHIHVTGDAGLEAVLDMLDRRMRENPRADHRTVLVHFASATEAQIGRIARLGAIVSANPYYPVGFADRFGPSIGAERADHMVRAASVLRHGIPLSFHSDSPVAPVGPLAQVAMAVNRQTASGRIAAPEQRIGVEDALRAVTIEAAYSWRREHELGSIAGGKLANFTVLGQDPRAVEPVRIADIPVWGTVFEGRVFPNRFRTDGSSVADARAIND
jgi:hypothetical protein